MDKKIDLRKKAPTPNPAAAMPVSTQPLPRLPGLPMEPGTVLNLSQTELDQLAALNWKKGDPIPNVAALIEDIKRDAEANLPDPNLPMVARPREIDIRTLPLEKQQQLQKAAAEMMEADRRLTELQQQHVDNPSSPGINAQIDQVLNGGHDQFQVVPPTPQQPKPVAVVEAVATAAEPSMRTAAPAPEFCKNCNHKTDQDPIEVTAEDKKNFLAMMIGGGLFMKQYELFGGQVQVTFRALTRAELDMAITQAGCDVQAGIVPNNSDFFRVAQNYEMVLSLRQIRSANGHQNDFPSSLDDVEVDPPEAGQPRQTKLKDYAPHVFAQIGSASMLRLTAMLYGRFYSTVRRLEENCFNADFWHGIETQI